MSVDNEYWLSVHAKQKPKSDNQDFLVDSLAVPTSESRDRLNSAFKALVESASQAARTNSPFSIDVSGNGCQLEIVGNNVYYDRQTVIQIHNLISRRNDLGVERRLQVSIEPSYRRDLGIVLMCDGERWVPRGPIAIKLNTAIIDILEEAVESAGQIPEILVPPFGLYEELCISQRRLVDALSGQGTVDGYVPFTRPLLAGSDNEADTSNPIINPNSIRNVIDCVEKSEPIDLKKLPSREGYRPSASEGNMVCRLDHSYRIYDGVVTTVNLVSENRNVLIPEQRMLLVSSVGGRIEQAEEYYPYTTNRLGLGLSQGNKVVRECTEIFNEIASNPFRPRRDVFFTPAQIGYDVIDEDNQLIRFNRGAVRIIKGRLPFASSIEEHRDLCRLIDLIEAQSPLLDADGELTFDAN